MLPFQRQGSAEWVVTLMSAAVGLLFIGAVLLLALLSSSRLPPRTAATRDKPVLTSFTADNEDQGRDP